MGEVDISLLAVLLFTVGACTFAIRMSYEKFCIRTGKPFKSWLGEGR